MAMSLSLAIIIAVFGCQLHHQNAWAKPSSALENEGRPLYMDPDATIEERVADLLSKMTTEEKIAQLVGIQGASLSTYKKTGFGWTKYTGSSGSRNELQAQYMESSRLHIPIAFWEESLHSSVPGGTVFPTPVLQGCTWNKTLIHDVASTIALEASSVGVEIGFTPVLNMFTDPRFGRHSEGFSENPTLSAAYATAAVIGYQGNQAPGNKPLSYLDDKHIISLAKHYAAYGDAAGGLNAGPAHIDMQTLFDIYLKPWQAFAANGGRAVMTSHQTVSHMPCHANPWLVNSVLRDKYMFGVGSIISDCNDIGVLVDYRVAANSSHAAAKGLIGGVDVDLMCGSDPSKHSYNFLSESLKEGLVTEKDIDAAASRVLASKFMTRLFDEPLVNNSAPSILNISEHRTLAFEAALAGITIAKRPEGKWPPADWPEKAFKMAIIGPNGGCMEDEYDYDSTKATSRKAGTYCEAQTNMIGPYAELKDVEVATIADFLKKNAGPGVDVSFALGCDIGSDSMDQLPKALQIAAEADIIILVVGDSLSSCSEWGDRDTLDLPGGQLEMIARVKNVSKSTAKLTMVLTNGRPSTFGPNNEVLDMIDYMLIAWRAGQMGASAIGASILGTGTPTGRLAQAWPHNVGQVNSGSSPWLQQVRGKWLANERGSVVDPDGRRYDDYVQSPATPLFPFGYGLSLSEFTYENLRATKTGNQSQPLMVSVDIKNVGGIEAVEVVQFYIQDPVLPWVPYWKRLIAFEKITVKPGDTQTVQSYVDYRDIALHDTNANQQIMPGMYTVRVGNCSNTDVLNTTVTFTSLEN